MIRTPRPPRTPKLRVLHRSIGVATLVLLLLSSAGAAWATPISAFVISEVMYEPSGGDNGRQWVELYNGTGLSIDLSSYELQWGRNGLSSSVTLSGTLAAGSTFVIGGPTSDANNGSPIFDQIFNFNPNLGDGGHNWQEDGIALFDTSTSTLMHIVVYGGNGVAVPYLDEQGATAVAVNDSALAPGQSLEYLGTDTWQVQATATPGAPNAALVPIPEPTPAVLLGLGLAALATLKRSTVLGGLLDGGPSRQRIRT